MAALIQAEESFFNWTFESSDCLYRDHLGQRVIADVEGLGVYEILSSPGGLDILTDGAVWSGITVSPGNIETSSENTGLHIPPFLRGAFEFSFLAVASDPGYYAIRGMTGRTEPPRGEPLLVDSFEGAGWIVDGKHYATVDETTVRAELASPEIPVPFFRSAHGSCLSIIPCDGIRCELIDHFSIADAEALSSRGFGVQNISAISNLESTFPSGVIHSAPVASHLNQAAWTCPLPKNCLGLRIQKTYDRFHGRQRARVLIDDDTAGWWYLPEQNRKERWASAEFGIPARFVEGKDRVRLALDPPAGSPLWSVSEIRAFALLAN